MIKMHMLITQLITHSLLQLRKIKDFDGITNVRFTDLSKFSKGVIRPDN